MNYILAAQAKKAAMRRQPVKSIALQPLPALRGRLAVAIVSVAAGA
jgi:hypothetical protein